MKKMILWSVVVMGILLFSACKKGNEKVETDMEVLLKKYNLTYSNGIARPELKFSSISLAEEYLKSRYKSDRTSSSIKVVRYIAKAKDGSYLWDSEIRNRKLYNDIGKVNSGLSSSGLYNNNSCGGGMGCHNSYFDFWDSWDRMNYDGNTDMHIQVTYSTNGIGQIGDVGLNVNPFGITPDQFSSNVVQTTINGDNIRVRFTTTQTNVINLGIGNFNSTTVTDWVVDLNTCSHTHITSYVTHG